MLRNLLTSIILLISSLSLSNAQEPNSLMYCSRYSVRTIEHILQYLYRLEGNLPTLNESKIKRLTYIRTQLLSPNVSDKLKHDLWINEMYNDADYWQLGLQNQLKETIKSFENIQDLLTTSSLEARSREYVLEARSAKATNRYDADWGVTGDRYPAIIISMNEANHLLQEHYLNLSEIGSELERLRQENRIEKGLDSDRAIRAQQRVNTSNNMTRLISCAINHLDHQLISLKYSPHAK